MITITYFGQLADTLGISTEQLDWHGGNTDDLLTQLRARGEPWASALQSNQIFKIALNQVLLHEPAQILDNAQIGILPPVTGG